MFLCSHEICTNKIETPFRPKQLQEQGFLPTELIQIPTLDSQIYNRGIKSKNRYRGISVKNSTLTQGLTEGEKIIMGRVVYLRV